MNISLSEQVQPNERRTQVGRVLSALPPEQQTAVQVVEARCRDALIRWVPLASPQGRCAGTPGYLISNTQRWSGRASFRETPTEARAK